MKMPGVVDSIFARVTGRQKERQTAAIQDVKQLAIFIGDAELGEGDKIDVDDDLYADAVERLDIEEETLRTTVEEYKARKIKSKLAAVYDERHKQAVAAEQAWRDAREAEARRRTAADRRIAELEEAMQHAITASSAALRARSDLIAGAERTPEERRLDSELAQVNQQLAQLDIKLNPNLPHPTAGASYTALRHPAAMAAECRRELSAEKKAARATPGRRERLEQSLKAAEKAIDETKKERAALEKRRDEINKRGEALTSEKLQPENFAITRAPVSRDDQQKQYARSLGLHHSPATRSVR